jgi:hypothetical protein
MATENALVFVKELVQGIGDFRGYVAEKAQNSKMIMLI